MAKEKKQEQSKKKGRPLLLLAVIVVALLYFVFGTESTDEQSVVKDVGKKAKEMAESTGEFLNQKPAEYGQKVRNQIGEYRAELKSLKEQATQLDSSSRVAMKDKIEKMSAQLDSLQKKAGKIGDSSGEAWTDLKAGIDGAFEKLKEGVQEAKSNFAKK